MILHYIISYFPGSVKVCVENNRDTMGTDPIVSHLAFPPDFATSSVAFYAERDKNLQ